LQGESSDLITNPRVADSYLGTSVSV
jgi:hypothetical protein